MAEAYLMYAEAAAKDPRNKTYWERTQAVQSRAAMEARPQPKIPAVADLDKELASQPELPFRPANRRGPGRRQRTVAADTIGRRAGLHDLDFTGDYKKVFQNVAHVFGLECVYDSDYQPGTSFRFRLKGVDYRDALHGLEAATGSFIVPITSKIFLVAKDTPQKRTEIEPTVTMSVHLPDIYTQQEFTEMIRDVQQSHGDRETGVRRLDLHPGDARPHFQSGVCARAAGTIDAPARASRHRAAVSRSHPQRCPHLRDRFPVAVFAQCADHGL